MKLTIKYFGMLVEATSITEELIHSNSCTVEELINALSKQYPKLKEQDFKVAVNQTLVSSSHRIESEVEIALLPPFAGG